MRHISVRFAVVCAVVLILGITGAKAATNTITIVPSQVPDEDLPRVNVGDSPAGFEPNSWQGPWAGKTNWHARYIANGDHLSAMFPADAATMTIGDLASISYFTKRPGGTPAGRDWWIQIYTRPTGVGDCAGWYHRRYINNYNDHTNLGSWTQYSTSSGMTFNQNSTSGGCSVSGEMTLAQLIASNGGDLIEMISVQTDSGWNGFDGYLDGLEVTLTNGNVGRVNFEAPSGRTTIEIEANPFQVPDEELPRVNVGDFPSSFEVDSWQGPLIGKTNWHAAYLPATPQFSYLAHLFPVDAPTLTIGDVAKISYFTKRPAGTQASRDWWVQIYTRPTGVGDCAGWYHRRYINNYNDHTNIGSWTQYSTDAGMTFNQNSTSGGCSVSGEMTLAELIAANGDDLILMFSVQTDSGWNGFDGFLDGLAVTLNNGNVGRVNFEDIKGGCCTNGPGTASPCLIKSQTNCEGAGGLYLGDLTACVGPLDCEALIVTFDSITAERTHGGVTLRWTTATEVDTVGFRILRESIGSREKMLRVVAPLIPSAGYGSEGASYEYVDRSKGATSDVRYFLEDIDMFGRVTRHGPIVVQPGDERRSIDRQQQVKPARR